MKSLRIEWIPAALMMVWIIFYGWNSQASGKDLKTVDSVDLERYQGTWYEIAKVPNSFQKKCIGYTTAQYRILGNGRVEVTNSCNVASGERDVAVGEAKIRDAKTNAKLKVSFAKVFGKYIYLFGGDYWVIGLDQDYQWVIVGHPSRKYGWILSRTPTLSAEVLSDLSKQLVGAGYDTCQFEVTVQSRGQETGPLCNFVQ